MAVSLIDYKLPVPGMDLWRQNSWNMQTWIWNKCDHKAVKTFVNKATGLQMPET